MPKLFVALDLPRAPVADLLAIRPTPGSGIRLTASDQMHLTLHCVGEATIEPIATALAKVNVPRFQMDLRGVGQFPTANGSVTLWAGVVASAELLSLHVAVGTAIANSNVAVRLETRPYTPHITLARCEPLADLGAVDEFLKRNATFGRSCVEVAAFALFSSDFVDGVPVYRRERTFPLLAKGDREATPRMP